MLPTAASLKSSSARRIRIVQRIVQMRAQSTFHDQEGSPYWNRVAPWKDVSTEEFMTYQWQVRNTVSTKQSLYKFLLEALPQELGQSKNPQLWKLRTKANFIDDAIAALSLAPMNIRLTPHMLSRIDWKQPLDDPIRKQFIPLRSGIVPDHEHLKFDSLHEEDDSPTPGLVHRYPGRALFLATSICPVYCRYCTRSYAVGGDTEALSKKPQKPSKRRWDVVFDHIAKDTTLEDIVVSGGDTYYLQPDQLWTIGKRLLDIPHIRRIRIATKGLAVAPCRILDENDSWTDNLIKLSNLGRKLGKQVCLHTHINHANEITWITKLAAQKLFENGVIVRNQAVLLKGVNNNEEALMELITTLANNNIQPYYVYQCDMVKGIEDLRTPLHEIIELDKKLRGKLSGFMMPAFVIDLPGGGGKRLVSTHESYDKDTGIARYRAPGLEGKKGEQIYTYHDPKPVQDEILTAFRQHQQKALHQGKTLDQFVFNPPKLPRYEPLRQPPTPNLPGSIPLPSSPVSQPQWVATA
ncbi:hypothetical protein ACN47E_007758 [Coniothyrium glycines]